MNQALCISTGNKPVTPHSLLLSLRRPVGNEENAKLLTTAKQVQTMDDQPHPKERKKHHRVKLISNEAILQNLTFVPLGLILSTVTGSKQILRL